MVRRAGIVLALMHGPFQPFVIGAQATAISGDAGEAAAHFAQDRAILCSGALDPPFLAALLRICGRAQFVPDEVEGVGHREVETPGLAGGALSLALKRANLIRWVEAATSRGRLGSVDGRVVQTRPAADDR